MSTYDPLIGNPDDPRRIATTTPDGRRAYIPRTMANDPRTAVAGDTLAYERLRIEHDFEFWCVRCVKIKDKLTGADIPFRLNTPQRRVLAMLEDDRLARRPIRIMLLKARQWGGSTLVQIYMAWIQMCHCANWHSIICSQVKDTSAGIRGMYAKLLDNYPEEFWPDGVRPQFRPYERSTNVREITGRGCRVTVSSVENQDAVRGADFAMAHLSETAFWRASPSHNPDDVIRAICGSIALIPNTLIAMESTANGVGNYFHSEWIRCRDGHGDKRTIFVPWYEIDIYRLEPDDPEALLASLDEYELYLRNGLGLSLDQINWYRHKSREYATREKMMAEYPTTDDEAFSSTSWGVFNRNAVKRLRENCTPPLRGELMTSPAGPEWHDDPCGRTAIWQMPRPEGRYVAAVDIGGRSDRSDWSVVLVVRTDTERPEVVAQWRGHIDHDILADIAARLAEWYGRALLAVESNTLESGLSGRGSFVLERLAEQYPNLYCRGTDRRPGFHTNRTTKDQVVTELIGYVRECAYVERDSDACDELLTYQTAPDGSYAAKPGCHDDLLMTRAIALHVARTDRPTHIPASYYRRAYW